MKRDAFSCRHPAVNFLFFLGAFCLLLQHPAYVAVGVAGALCYSLLLNGQAGRRLVLTLLPVTVLIAFLNPLVNTNGQTVLFLVFGRPYTWEALCYGAVLAGMLLSMLLWFSCFNKVMTGDKFTGLFGNLIPTLSLLLVMVLRMVPALLRKGRQIIGARRSIGKGADDSESFSQRLHSGLLMLGCLTAWALEGSVSTADSMRSRGYGTARRSSFALYRMSRADWIWLGVLSALLLIVAVSVLFGAAAAEFTPQWYIAPIAPIPFAAYCIFVFIPTLLHMEEAIAWRILRSKI